VAPEKEERPAPGQFGIPVVRRVRAEVRLPRLHHHDLADCAAIDQLLGPHERGGEDFSLQIPVAHAARADGLEHRARLGGGPPEGLGAEQAAPGLGEAEADVLVAKRPQAPPAEGDPADRRAGDCVSVPGSREETMATLITGGTGLIGACLAEKLLAHGERVVLFDLAIAERRIAPLRSHGDRLQVVQGDVQSVVALLDVVRAHGVTAIVHLAYLLGHACNQSPERATRVNILGTVNVLEAARLSGLERVLLASSIAVYGSDEEYAPGERPLREDVP